MQKCIVVGAGILGASTAYHLVKAGVKVTLMDREDTGQATDAAAGIVCPWLTQRRNKAWYQLVKGGARYYPYLIEQLKEDAETETGYDQVGAISLHTDIEKLDKMEERAYQRREDAPEIGEITRLSPSETKAMFPPLSNKYGSVHISGAARVNGRALRDSLVRAAKKNGATFLKSSAQLVFQDKKVTGIQTEHNTLEADQVIVTAGAWSKELLQPLGIQFLVRPQKAQIVHLEVPGIETKDWPVVMPPNNQYLLAFGRNRVVVGATHEDNVGFDARVTPGGLHEIFDKALNIAPGLADSTMIETRVGFRPFTPGSLPVFGAIPDYEGLFVANGLGASGLTSGPYLGSELAKLVLNKQTDLDLTKYQVAEAIKNLHQESCGDHDEKQTDLC